jgi:hypothetical protein
MLFRQYLLQHTESSLQNDRITRHVELELDVGAGVGCRDGRCSIGGRIGVGFDVTIVPGGKVGFATPHLLLLVQKLLQQ